MTSVRIMSLIEQSAAAFPNSVALIDVKGNSVSFANLNATVIALAEYLHARGIQRNQRVAVVIENGLEMAVVYLAVSNIASFVPLSSDFTIEQYSYYLDILKTDTLIVSKENHEELLALATERKMTVYNLVKKEGKGTEDILYDFTGGPEPNNFIPVLHAKDDDIAVVNYTSGTTSTPKIVPRSHINEYTYSQICKAYLNLTSQDRLLLITPMSRHISLDLGLSVLGAGGCIICADKYEPNLFFRLLSQASPTWFSASPVVYQNIIDYAENNHINDKYNLRFVMSAGAPLFKTLEDRIQRVFKVPVYNAYGSTEAALIASNSKSPIGMKDFSLGVPEFVDLAIMDEKGQVLSKYNKGEIVVRGPQVIKRYDNDEQTNKDSYQGEWFRTGDEGYLDEDGYLFITGRFKEIINRGGEKISPYEVEDALCQHPDVLKSVVFPMPSVNGNEDAGAAIVLKTGSKMYLKDMRRFLYGKVVAFKIPTVLYILNEIPASDAGKIQRKKLYDTIISRGIIPQPEADENEILIMPRNDTEIVLYDIFKKILPAKMISVTDTFFELGGDSLKTAELFTQIKEKLGTQVPLKYIFSNGSIEDLARYITGGKENNELHPFVMPFQENGTKTPIFFIHSADGESVMYRHIAMKFDPERPFYGITFNPEAVKWKHPITFEQIAENYIKDIISIQPEGPYILAAQCVGGIIACEMAKQLKKAKQEIALLAIFDAILPDAEAKISLKNKIKRNMDEIKSESLEMYLDTKWYYYKRILYKKSPGYFKKKIFNSMDKKNIIGYARADYKMKKYDGDIVFFKPDNNNSKDAVSSVKLWSKLARDIRIIQIQGNHTSAFYPENAEYTRQAIEDLLADIP